MKHRSILALALVALTSQGAFAGALQAPVQAAPIAPPPAPAASWEGAYVGLYGGSGFNGTTPLAGIWAGYNFQNQRLVYGGEINGQFYTDGTGDVEVFVRGRLGYAVSDELLLFGALGTGNYIPGGGGANLRLNVIGIGGEYRVTDKLSLRADFNKENLTGSPLLSGPNFINIGAVWNF